MANRISGLDYLHLLLMRLSMVVMWLTFFVFHLTAFVLAIVVLWWLQISPEGLVERVSTFSQSLPVVLAGLVGLSAATVFAFWVKLWRRLYAKTVIPYIFRDVNENVGSAD